MAKQSSLGTPQEVQTYANAIDRNTPELGAPALPNAFLYLNSQNVITTQQATKGSLQVGTAGDPQLLSPGSDNTLIVADSTQTTGMKWTTELSWDETNRNLIAAHSSAINGANCSIIGADNCNIINGSTSSMISSGYQNTIDGSQNSSILGGTQQQISSGSMSSAILYGNSNTVQGQFSCAGGHHASISHDSCFVITDSALQTTDNFQILFGATNGFGFYSAVMDLTTFPNNFLNFYADPGDNHAKLQFKDSTATVHTIDFSALGTGTVTSITAGTNLTGGTITTSGTIALSANPSGLTSLGVGNFSISGSVLSASGSVSIGSSTSDNPMLLKVNNSSLDLQDSSNTISIPLRLFNAAGSHATGFQAGNPSATTIYTLPLAFPGTTQALVSDSSGILSFAQIPADINTYTPGPVATANITSFTAYTTFYKDLGDCVRVWGRIDVQTTLAATLTQLDLSLPIVGPSNFTDSYDGAGNASAYATLDNNIGIIAVPSTQKIRLSWITANTAPQALTFDFIYRKTT